MVEGIFCASFTAFAADGSIDRERTVGHARDLIDMGCAGVALLGTTGEANSLSCAERMTLLEAAVGQGIDPARLLPGTGLCSVPETIMLTRHALDCGVRTLLLLPPFYYPNPDLAGLVDHYARILDGVADDRLRILLYNIPQMTGISIDADLIDTLRRRYPDNVVGIKDSSGDLKHMQDLVAAFPGFSVLAGADPLVGPLLRSGGAGGITATANLIAPLLVELFDHVRSGAEATDTRALEDRVAALRNLFQNWPQIPALKAGKAIMSGDRAWHHVRPPMVALAEGQWSDLADAMRHAGLEQIAIPTAA